MKPCPFCESKNLKVDKWEGRTYGPDHYYVKCECGARGPTPSNIWDITDTEGKAIERWNTRRK